MAQGADENIIVTRLVGDVYVVAGVHIPNRHDVATIVLHGESRGHFERLCSHKKNAGSGGEHEASLGEHGGRDSSAKKNKRWEAAKTSAAEDKQKAKEEAVRQEAITVGRRHEKFWLDRLTAMTQSSSQENLKELALDFRIPVVKLRGDVNEIAATLKQRCPDLPLSTCKISAEMLQWYFGCRYPLFSAVQQK